MECRAQWLITVTDVLGWTYFAVWTISFYPQVIINYRTKSTVGLSYDFVIYNLIGFLALATFDIIRYATQQEHHLARAVGVEDLTFAIHSVLLCCIGTAQILHYNYEHFLRSLSWKMFLVVAVIVCAVALHIILWQLGFIPLTQRPANESQHLQQAWSLTDLLVWIKLIITLVKYIPQILLNCKRKSTHGLAIWQFNLDLTGGIFSLLQVILQCINFKTLSFITGNVPKFGIGLVTLGYDGILLAQKYCIYPSKEDDTELKEQLSPLARKESQSPSQVNSELQALNKASTK